MGLTPRPSLGVFPPRVSPVARLVTKLPDTGFGWQGVLARLLSCGVPALCLGVQLSSTASHGAFCVSSFKGCANLTVICVGAGLLPLWWPPVSSAGMWAPRHLIGR